MVLGPVSRYSLVNAKVRARLSTLIPPETINRLAETKEPAEFYAALGGTPYEKALSAPEVSFDPRVAEKLLVEQEIEWHIELERELKGSASDLIAHFLEKYEIENIKTALRIREGSRDIAELSYIVLKGMPHIIDYQAIAEARSIEDALALLGPTRYHGPLKGALAAYAERGTLFPLEIALEVDYYRRLMERVNALARTDREIAKRLIGLEIDQKNLGWLIRLKFYYDVPTGDLLAYNIPGGYRLKESRLRQALMGDSVKGAHVRPR